MECPICKEEIEQYGGDIFDHLIYLHDLEDTRILLFALMKMLSCMDIKELKL